HREVRRLVYPGFADQRLGQALRMMRVIEAEAPLDAEPFVVGRSIAALDSHDAVVLDVIGELAADAAVRTKRSHLAIDRDEVRVVSGRQSAGRAGLHALSAGHTGRLAHGIAQVENDL